MPHNNNKEFNVEEYDIKVIRNKPPNHMVTVVITHKPTRIFVRGIGTKDERVIAALTKKIWNLVNVEYVRVDKAMGFDYSTTPM
jgi:hypothetical protein